MRCSETISGRVDEAAVFAPRLHHDVGSHAARRWAAFSCEAPERTLLSRFGHSETFAAERCRDRPGTIKEWCILHRFSILVVRSA